ncbi:MAG: SH3 domain-containing protein [Planctomycetaceae bacterium]|nr:SH3 domain-containing protein [Planctomycetaceae bacterium]
MRGLTMRLDVFAALAFLAGLVCLAAVVPATFAAEFPFDGYIAAREAEVASGPGRRFYTTDKLPRGTKVEVYREDDAGWLAIRPPEGSFSWVPAEHVEPQGDDMGKVLAATESWIGTSIEDVKQHKSQVSLKAGELVEIKGRKKVTTADGDQAWLKISPPAGEFRFVHSRDVSRERVEVEEAVAGESGTLTPALSQREREVEDTLTPDALTPALSQAERETEEPRAFRPSTSAIALRDIDEVRSRLAAMREDLAGLAGRNTKGNPVQQVQFQAAPGSDRWLSPDGFVPRKRRASEQLGPVPVPGERQARSQPQFTRPTRDASGGASLSPAASRAHVSLAAQPIASQPITNQPISSQPITAQALDELAQLELDLSLMVAQDKSTWNLAAIRARAEKLVEHGPTAAERGQARLLLDKIKQFEDAFSVADQGLLASSAAGGSELPPGSPYAPRYDAKGWLKPVVSRTKPAAPYAVVDEDGKPLCFVTPSPGLNLARYSNKQVGLFGKRGYIEALKTPHVVAERVIDLERH